MFQLSDNNIPDKQANGNKKMVVFELDNVLLKGNFVLTCADKFIFDQELVRLKKATEGPLVLLKSIAKLFCGLTEEQLLAVIAEMELVDGAKNMVVQLQRRGYIVGIISNSFQFAADYIRNLLGLDFAIANRLEFINGKATGILTIPAYYFYQLYKKCDHGFCKANALIYVSKNYEVPLHHTIAVGSTEKDLCIIKQSGVGIALGSKDKQLQAVADKVIDKLTFEAFLDMEQFFKKVDTIS